MNFHYLPGPFWFQESPDHFNRAIEGTVEMRPHRFLPLVRSDLQQRRGRDISRVVDHYVERAVAPIDGIGNAFDVSVTPDIEQTAFRLRSRLPDPGEGLPQGLSISVADKE